jgi:AraC-like DNA-binding protein
MDWIKVVEISISITGIINCLLVAFLLFLSNQGILKANRILSLLLIAICLKLSYALLINFEHVWGIPSMMIYYLAESGFIAMGPLLYLYYLAYMKKDLNTGFVLGILVPSLIPFVGFYNGYDVPLWLMQAYFTGWLVLIFFQLKNYYLLKTANIHFKTEKFWMNTIYASFILIWMVVNFLLIDFEYYLFELSAIFTLLIYVDIYLYVKHYWLKKGDQVDIKTSKRELLTIEKENEIYAKLQQIMDSEKLYIDPEITLPKVAAKIHTRPHHLSYVINKRMEMTFNEYINSYRINDIKNAMKLKEYQEMKIASIASDYGFNTISAFNIAFKKFTNYTPSQYRTEVIVNSQN